MAKKPMTAHELARRLLREADLPVRFAYPSHDYWQTNLASEVNAVEAAWVGYSEYHRQDKVLDPDDGEEEVKVLAKGQQPNRLVILLS